MENKKNYIERNYILYRRYKKSDEWYLRFVEGVQDAAYLLFYNNDNRKYANDSIEEYFFRHSIQTNLIDSELKDFENRVKDRLDMMSQMEQKKCRCDIAILVNRGCQCGGV